MLSALSLMLLCKLLAVCCKLLTSPWTSAICVPKAIVDLWISIIDCPCDIACCLTIFKSFETSCNSCTVDCKSLFVLSMLPCTVAISCLFWLAVACAFFAIVSASPILATASSAFDTALFALSTACWICEVCSSTFFWTAPSSSVLTTNCQPPSL